MSEVDPTGFDSQQRLRWPPAERDLPTHHDELCLRLAHIRCERNAEERAQRMECEALLNEAVELRAKRRELQEDARNWRQEAVAEAESEERSKVRSERAHRGLMEELQAGQSELRSASVALRDVSDDWAIEDEPELRLKQTQEECDRARESANEWREAHSASEQLAERLSKKLGTLEESLTQLRARSRNGGQIVKKSTLNEQELEKLRQDVKLLSARVALSSQEVGEEAKLRWLNKDQELLRLRAAEWERQQLVGRLGEARYDRDTLQRSYNKVVSGLQEQEMAMENQAMELHSSLSACRLEGEEMVASMKENDQSIAEMRKDRWETEAFIEHLSTQVARLEDERNALKASLADNGSPRAGVLKGMDPDVQASALELLDSHDRAHIDLHQQEAYQQFWQDEEDVEAVSQELRQMENHLQQAENRNHELRSEVSAVRPLLGK